MKKLKEKLSGKLKKQGGFTLIEMLIVVAIIAILVAISIPLVTASLDKAREATDDANLRAAKGEAVIMYMNDQLDNSSTLQIGMIYDNVSGIFKPSGSSVTGYGQYGSAKGKVIKVTAIKGGATQPTNGEVVTVDWG